MQSISQQVQLDEIIQRLNSLERKVEKIVIPLEKKQAKKDKLTPTHIMFGKWGLADGDGELVDAGPYSKEEAKKRAAAQ